MRRLLPTLLLLSAFAALGSGLLEHLHLRTHALQHADHPSPEHQHPAGGDDDARPCELCAHLQIPRISAGWAPLLVCLGLFVAFLTQLSPRLAPQRVAARIDCRGPPLL